MSKTTRRYGKPLYSMSTSIDATPKPTRSLVRQLARLNDAAKNDYNKPYHALTDQQKTDLHYKLAVARQKAREERESREVDNDLDQAA